jgi:hypothetical protein
MAYQTGNSVTVSDENETSGATVDLATYGLTLIGGDFPMEAEPDVETVNMPFKVGGYTYWNTARPTTLTMDVVVEADSVTGLMTYLQAIAAATATSQVTMIMPDLYPAHYWLGRRTSGIPGIPKGQRALAFTMTFVCDDATVHDRES